MNSAHMAIIRQSESPFHDNYDEMNTNEKSMEDLLQ